MAWSFSRALARRKLAALAAAIAVAIAIVALLPIVSGTGKDEPAARQPFVEIAPRAYILQPPDALARFALVKHDATRFDNASFAGRWSFVIFGYTSCPDFCPTTLAEFAELHRLLTLRSEDARDVQFVLISVDPERDTPALLAAYVPQFHLEFIGVTGTKGELARLADSVGAVYAKVAGAGDGDYHFDHSTAALLIDPEGQLRAVFGVPHVAADMATAFAKIRARRGSDRSLTARDR